MHALDDPSAIAATGAIRVTCTAPNAICTTRMRCRRCFPSIPDRRVRTCRGFGRVIGIDYGAGRSRSRQKPGAAGDPSLADTLLQGDARTTCCAMPNARRAARCPWRDLSEADRELGHGGGRSPGQEEAGMACGASSPGSRPRPIRCISGCCCRSTAATPCARPATAHASSPMRCSGA